MTRQLACSKVKPPGLDPVLDKENMESPLLVRVKSEPRPRNKSGDVDDPEDDAILCKKNDGSHFAWERILFFSKRASSVWDCLCTKRA